MEAKLRRPYQKPAIERITLVGEMQAALGCKSQQTPTVGKSNKGCGSSQCKTTYGS